ncbi:MAG: hypothetical protein ACKVWR_06915 [Acidimicrobiales bacterium]
MPVYGDEKRLQMARSILMSRGNVRQPRQRAHRRDRGQARAALRAAPVGDDFDDRPLSLGVRHEIAELVFLRRAWDKTEPFLRWANAHAAGLGSTPEERLAAMRARLPKNLAGSHALSHLCGQDAFAVDRFSLRRSGRRPGP